MINEGNLEHKEGRKLTHAKILANTIDSLSLSEFSKLHLGVGAKTVTLLSVALNVGQGNVEFNYMIKGTEIQTEARFPHLNWLK